MSKFTEGFRVVWNTAVLGALAGMISLTLVVGGFIVALVYLAVFLGLVK